MDETNKKIAREKILTELKTLAPQVEINESGPVPSINYYSPSVVQSRVVVGKNSRAIYLNDSAENLAKIGYLTEAEARAAIAAVLPEAEQKFRNCLAALNQLEKSMGFKYDFNYEGDTHGIYEEHRCINFMMQKFWFSFKIEDN